MSLKESLNNLKVEDNTNVVFSYEQGTDVFHFNETEVETAISDTDVVERVATVATSGLKVTTEYGGEPLQILRDADLLEDYERGSGNFEEYVAGAIRENFYDADLIEHSTEKYDHKRGFTTLTARVQAPLSEVLNKETQFNNVFSGWTAEVSTGNGKFSIDI